jgi:predicted PurR-regulated permease PerM
MSARQATLGVLGLAVSVALLYLLSGVLLPFVAGLVLAYLLDPLADRIQRLGIGRLAATLLILVVFVLGFVLVLILVVPFAAKQLAALGGTLPGTVARLQTLVTERFGGVIQYLGGEQVLTDLQSSLGDILGQASGWLGTFLRSLWSGGQAVIGLVSLLVVSPIVAFYLLVDWDRMVETVDGWTPPRHRPVVRSLAREMDRTVSGFIRGQALVCLILGTLYATGLFFIGLNFGVLIGMIAGVLTIIPYVGTLAGFILGVGVALVQFWPDWVSVAMVVGVFAVGQFLEGNIISPKLVGDAVGLHPVWLMFALLAFGALFGFLGLLLAVPVAAAIGVLVRFGIGRYLQSRYYHGGVPEPRSEA